MINNLTYMLKIINIKHINFTNYVFIYIVDKNVIMDNDIVAGKL